MSETTGPEFVTAPELAALLQVALDLSDATQAAQFNAALALAETMVAAELGTTQLGEHQVVATGKLGRAKALLELPDGPLADLDSIETITVGGAALLVTNVQGLPWALRRTDTEWPAGLEIIIDYVAGYSIDSGGDTNIPETVRQAILVTAKDLYQNPNLQLFMERIGDYMYQRQPAQGGQAKVVVPAQAQLLLRNYREATAVSSARSYDQTWLTAYQAIPRCLNGDTVWVIGGGPSLRNFDPGCLEGREVIVTNEAFALVPTALALVFVDVGWYQRRKTEIRNRFKGKFIIGRGNYRKIYATDGCLNVAYRSGMQWSENPKILGGKNSGLAAVNAAWLMGAGRAILLGFDMRPVVDEDGTQRNNYHSLHPQSGVPNYTHRYAHLFLPEFKQAAVSMEQHGFVVINATPGSALKCCPERTLEWCLGRYPAGTAKGVPAVA